MISVELRQTRKISDFIHVEPNINLSRHKMNMPEVLGKVERALVELALVQAGGNKAKASALLGIKRTTLVMMLRRYGVPVSEIRCLNGRE